MPKIPAHISEQLAALDRQNQLRTLKIPFYGVDFTSNDYLGLSQSPRNSTSGKEGSGGSRLLAGNWAAHTAVETFGTQYFHGEAALLFGSGYMANLGVLSCLPHRSHHVFYDERCHASIKDGLRLGMAPHQSYRHNDWGDLRQKMARVGGPKWVVTEGLFSMDGTIPDLAQLAELCREFEAWLVVDEAHSTGILGPNGRGACAMYGIEAEPIVRIHAFGKAVGRAGALAVAPQTIVQYLINRSRPFIYTTAMPPAAAISLFHALRSCESAELEREQLAKAISYAQQLPILGQYTHPQSPIVSVQIPGNDHVKQVAAHLQAAGLDVRPILSPTVPVGTERLRIVLHSFNTETELNQLESALQPWVH
jgi:8-amino-7-oxononanoate synthase